MSYVAHTNIIITVLLTNMSYASTAVPDHKSNIPPIFTRIDFNTFPIHIDQVFCDYEALQSCNNLINIRAYRYKSLKKWEGERAARRRNKEVVTMGFVHKVII